MKLFIALIILFSFFLNCTNKSRRESGESEQAKSEGLAIFLNESFGMVDPNSSPQYPDYYGGYYFDENGKLVILIVKDHKNYKDDLNHRVRSRDYITIPCDYSYNDLLDVHKRVTDFFLDEANESIINEITINSLGIDSRNNRILISLREATAEKIALFKNNVVDSPMIVFEEWNGLIMAE